MQAFISRCEQSPDLRAFVLYDEHRVYAGKGELLKELHTSFVAIQQLAENVGYAVGARSFVNAAFCGEDDQFLLRRLEHRGLKFSGAFWANSKVSLPELVEFFAIQCLIAHPDPESSPVTRDLPAETVVSNPERPTLKEVIRLQVVPGPGLQNMLNWHPSGRYVVQVRRHYQMQRSAAWDAWSAITLSDLREDGGVHIGSADKLRPGMMVRYRIGQRSGDRELWSEEIEVECKK